MTVGFFTFWWLRKERGGKVKNVVVELVETTCITILNRSPDG